MSSMLWTFPLITIEAIVAARSLSFPSLVLLLISFCLVFAISRCAQVLARISQLKACKSGLLDRFPTSPLKAYELSEYLPQNVLDSYEGKPLKAWDKILTSCSVLRVDDGLDGSFPAQLKAYQFPLTSTLIFIRDRPSEIGAVGRFFILHEAGHAVKATALSAMGFFEDLITTIVSAIWIAVHISPYLSEVQLTVVVFVLWFVARYITVQNHQHAFKNELDADRFAIENSSLRDLEEIKPSIENGVFPLDDKLSKKQQEVRQRLLIRAIEQRLSGSEVQVAVSVRYSVFAAAVTGALTAVLGFMLPPVEQWGYETLVAITSFLGLVAVEHILNKREVVLVKAVVGQIQSRLVE